MERRQNSEYLVQNDAELLAELSELIQARGIRGMLVDMDDTLVDTTKLYISKMEEFSNFVASRGLLTTEAAFAVMRETIEGLRAEYSVHPALMYEAGRLAALVGGVDLQDPTYKKQLDSLTNIFYESPDVFPGVTDTLDVFLRTGIDVGLVTHASVEWTDIKRKDSGLTGKFKIVHCIDPAFRKDKYEWWQAAYRLKVPPQELIIVGDSWKSDIHPALEMGVPEDQIFRITTDYGLSNKGRVANIRELETFNDLPFAVVYNFRKTINLST